jgi:hypothetical protein
MVAGGFGGVALAATLWGVTRTTFALGVGVAMLVAAVALSATALGRWSERKRLAVSLLAALDTVEETRAITAARVRTDRIIGLYRLEQNLALVLGVTAVVIAGVLSDPFSDGISVGAVLAVFLEQGIDHGAEEHAMRYTSVLDAG